MWPRLLPSPLSFETRPTSLHLAWLVSALVTILLLGGGWQFLRRLEQTYGDRFYPGVVINNINVAKKTRAEAHAQLEQQFTESLTTQKVELVHPSSPSASVATSAAQLGLTAVITPTLDQAYQVGRNESWLAHWQRLLLPSPPTRAFPISQRFDHDAVVNLIAAFKPLVITTGEEPRAELSRSGVASSLTIRPGQVGQALDEDQTAQALQDAANGLRQRDQVITIPAVIRENAQHLDEAQVKQAAERATKFVGKSIAVKTEDFSTTLSDQEVLKFLTLPTGYNETALETTTETWKSEVDRAAQNPVFEYDPTNLIVNKFIPPADGLALDLAATQSQLRSALQTLETSDEKTVKIELPVQRTEPTTSLESTNQLGIKEQIGFGESFYAHSIPNRIHNVALTAARVNNIIVPAGAEFSFNKALGDVSALTGFKQAYVIRNGRTELGDGGGVCQVSTTTFRAALNAGLPITKRRAHSYRVSYYELNAKPGIDATVYAGDVDLRFINDTGHAMLIHTFTDSKRLYMNVRIFGTSDGRTTEIVDHKTWGYASAPAPLYIDDATIPRGKVKQIDFAAAGIKASFKNVVKNKAGEVLRTEEYFSNYVPWRAVFLRGI